jgi:hypothetical protein
MPNRHELITNSASRESGLVRTRGVLVLLSSIWALTALPYVTDAAIDLPPLYGFTLSAIALSFAWCVYAALVWLRNDNRGRIRLGRAGAIHVGMVALVALLAVTNVDLAARVWLSAAALHQLPLDARLPARVGLFQVRERDRAGSCDRFITTRNFLDDAGVVFCEHGSPPRVGEDSYVPLYGQWWVWCRSW